MLKKILIFLLIVLVIMQFFRPKKNIAAGTSANNIASVYSTPQDVKQLLQVSCNDCHSSNTRYPWYAEVQPVALWLKNHIDEGKRQLNFDDFATYTLRRQYNKMEEVIKLVKSDEMPLNSYTWIHKDAILSAEQKQKLITWAEGIRNQMQQKYPMDSLIKKK
jgi:Haem-binding domain